MRKISLVIHICCLLSVLPGWAQYYPLQTGTISVCGGVITDSGGTAGNYGPNETIIMTICPDGSSGSHTKISFAGVDIRLGDTLCFYDGPNIFTPQLSCNTDFLIGTPFIIQATPTNVTGCVTMRFKSNATTQGKGWTGIISCIPACQAFSAQILSTTPATVPADTGWIDICPGNEVTFAGDALFFQNNLQYFQENNLSTFEWDFGDGNIQYGLNGSHVYQQPGGYKVTLSIIDQLGCKNTNYISRRVRVAPPPAISIGNLPGPLCQNDTLELSASTQSSGNENLKILAQQAVFDLVKIRADSIPLPDGTGALYQTSLTFTEFGPDQTLTDPSQITSICANMEHSWMRDLRITLTCPTGQSIVLVNQEETGEEVFLGVPFEDDELLPVPIPGQGFTYCWNSSAPNGTWLDYANQFMPKTLPASTYSTYESMDGLIGCPLNGEWVLSIQDLWAIDNGYIFWWNISFEDNILPPKETFTPVITDLEWAQQDNIILHKGKDIQGLANTAGQTFFELRYSDNFQCSADTFVTIEVLPLTHPNCMDCTTLLDSFPNYNLCEGDTLQLQSSINGFTGATIPFARHDMLPLGYSTHPLTAPYRSPIDVTNIYPLTIGANGAGIESVCFNMESTPINNIAVYLEAPDGTQLELTTYNGGLGSDYLETCFSPSSFDPITGGSPPFSNTYQPEGDWNTLDGVPINGTWHLIVSDNFGLSRMGLLKNWTISFNATNDFTYNWSPDVSLSCLDCPNPEVTADQTRTYTLSAYDQYGCTDSQPVTVNVTPVFEAPVVQCGESTHEGLRIFWAPIAGAASYEVNINLTGWVSVNGNLEHLITGLVNNSQVSIQIRVTPLLPSCPSEESTIECHYFYCQMFAVVEQTNPPSCYGGNDGEAYISAYNGTSPFNYNLDNQTNQAIGYFNQVSAGDHFVIVTDGNACVDTVYFTLGQPDPISISLLIDSVSCFGGNDGSVMASASGGTGSLSYIWFTIPATFNPNLINRPAGSFMLRVTDSNNCIKDSLVTLHQPAPLALVFETDTISCSGLNNGSATALTTGGNGGFTYLWSNNQMDQTATNLASGTYDVTVSDVKGCTISGSTSVEDAAPNSYQLGFIPPPCYQSAECQAWVDIVQAPLPVQFQWLDPAMQTSDTATALLAGSYFVIAEDGKGCIDTLHIQIPEPDSMVLQITPGMATCPGSTDGMISVQVISGGNSPYTYKWNDPSGQTDSVASGLSYGMYSVTVTDQNGCTQEAAGYLPMADGLVLDVLGTDASCSTSLDGSATVVVMAGTGPFSFLWDDPSASIDSIAVNLSPGIYTVIVTGSEGCTGSISLSVGAINELAIDQINVTPPTCFGDSDGLLEVVLTGVQTGLTYNWSDPSNQSTNPAVGLTGGGYQVTITDDAGCTVVGQAQIQDPSPVMASLVQDDVRCKGGNDGSITVTPSGGTGNYTYQWNTTPPQFTSTASNLTSGNYEVTVSDQNGCSLIAQQIVDEPLEDILILLTQQQQGCAGTSMNILAAQVTGGSGLGYQYQWSNGQITANNTQIPAGNYSITITDDQGCSATSQITAVDLEPIIIELAGDMPGCYNQQDGQLGITLISGGIGGGNIANYTYSWNTVPAQSGPNAQNLLGGTTYSVTATDGNGCTGSAQYLLDQPLAIDASIISQDVLCFGESTGSVEITAITGGSGSYTILWDNNAGSSPNSVVTNLSAGSYNVSITDSNGCQHDTTITVGQPPTMYIQLEVLQDPTCHSSVDGILSVLGIGGSQGYQYHWSNGMTGNMLTGLDQGIYQLTLTDQAGCTIEDNFSLLAPSPIDIALDITDPDCQDKQNGQISVIATGGTGNFLCSLNSGAFKNEYLFGPLRPGTYSIMVKDENGCTSEITTTLVDPQAFAINLGEDITIELGDEVILSAIHNSPTPLTLEWSAPYEGTLSCTLCDNPTASPSYTITYSATGTDQRGCSASDEITIFVEQVRIVLVPTAFTPNGDGRNDKLLVHGKDGTVIKAMRVFDRWGEPVFEAENFNINDAVIGWDGTFRNAYMNPGVYIWVLDVEYSDGFRQQLSGQTTLIR